ncbi:MAG: TlpA family protein disulfide reductase [Limisphaerales bacterium]
MKKVMFVLLMAAAWGTIDQAVQAQAQTTQSAQAAARKIEPVDFGPELAAVTAQLKAKFDAGKTSTADLAENLTAINGLIVKHLKDGNREQVARLYLLDAHIYADGLTNSARARAICAEVVRDFPNTLAARGAAISLAKLDAKAAAEPGPNVPVGLEVGQRFPDFNETDIAGQPLSVAAYRGRVTMIDFWATWCGPCRAEMPNVIATYNRYYAQGFNIIGVSLDDDQNAVLQFTQAQGMAWQQYFDGKGWDNKLAAKYGIHSIPMDYLLDRHGVIIGKGLRGGALQQAVAKAVTKY